VYIHQTRLHFKTAFLGKGFDWHTDFGVWRWEDGMMEQRCVTFMIPLDEMRLENSPLHVIPGSHLSCDEFTWESEVQAGENTYREDSKTHRGACRVTEDQLSMIRSSTSDTILAKPGDLIYFDANLLHMSEDNISQWDRMTIFIVINSMHNKLQDPPNGRSPRGERVASRDFNKL
jgi:ectoine hydroxylase